jgi:hypothetical protein
MFGWSYPPGVSKLPWDDCPEPSREADQVGEICEEILSGACESPQKAIDKAMMIVEDLVVQRQCLEQMLWATRSYLPLREEMEEPACTCTQVRLNEQWCERHDGGWDEPTIREEVDNYFNAKKESK